MFNWLLSIARAEEAAGEAVSEVAEQEPTWLQSAFEKFAEMPLWGWFVLAVLLIGGVVLYSAVRGEKRTVWTTRMVSLGAVCIALSSVLSLVRLYRMPMGGSITPASMLPLMLFAYIYGAGPGVTLGIIYSILQIILDGGSAIAYGIVPLLIDYPIAYGLLGLAGLFKGSKSDRKGLIAGVVVGCVGRYLASFVSGWVFYGEYCTYYGFASPVVYSICYNGAYMLPECVICVLVAVLVGPQLVRELRKVK